MTTDPAYSRPTLRWAVLAAIAGAGLTALACLCAPDLPALRKVEDFGVYWASARLNATGGNPYSIDDLRPLEQSIDPSREHILYMFNPPWVLGFFTPWGLLPWPAARLLWLAVQAVLLLWSADRLWCLYGGSPQHRSWAWLVAFSFFPTLQLLALGQTTVVTLAGIVGFLLWQRQRPLLAGIAAGFTLLKLHLVLVLWAPLGLWCLHGRHWRVLIGALIAVGALTAVAWAVNLRVFVEFFTLWGTHPPAAWVPPTPGSLLRAMLGMEKGWLALIFPALGVGWAALRWWYRRDSWDWARETPLLLLVCFLTAAYGWAYDLVLLLPALLQGVVEVYRRGRCAIAVASIGFFLLTGLAVAMNLNRCEEYLFFWIAPAVLVAYLYLRRPAIGQIPLAPVQRG